MVGDGSQHASDQRAARCGPTHHHACDCREAQFADAIAALREKLEKAEARVAVLTEECRAARKMRDVVLSADESRILMVACNGPGMFTENGKHLHARCDRIHAAAADFDTARFTTGPLPKESTDA